MLEIVEVVTPNRLAKLAPLIPSLSRFRISATLSSVSLADGLATPRR